MYPQVKENIQIKGVIGSGGTAKVFLAFDKWANKNVAVKMLFKSKQKDAFIKHKFKQEANVYLYLKHKNIVELTDYIEKKDADFIVMEYVAGKNLDEYIKTVSGPLVGENLLKIFTQVLAGVAHAHHNNINHLDIKPSNILINNQMKVKVVDFGISSTKEEKIVSAQSRMMGTPMYMSPEQIENKNINRLSDIYSLGITLFYLVTANMPYQSNSLKNLFHKIKNEPLPAIIKYYPFASKKLQEVINKATAKKQKNRFQSCEEFSYFLEEALK